MGIHEHGYVCSYSKDILGNPKIIHILFFKELYLVEGLVIQYCDFFNKSHKAVEKYH